MSSSSKHQRDLILILDFGGQYTQLIARRVREQKVYSEIHPFNVPLAKIRELAPRGIILSGGPASCYDPAAPKISSEVYELGVPILGICYGVQLTALSFGGKVVPAERREYGRATVRVKSARRSVPRLRGRRGDPGLDEPRRPRRGAARRLRGRRRERELPGGGGGGAGAQVLGRAVPPRGGAHAARRGDPRQLPVPDLRLRAELDDGRLRERGDRRGERQGRGRPGAPSAACRAASIRRWRRRWC